MDDLGLLVSRVTSDTQDFATVVTLTPRGDKTEMMIVEDTTTTEFMHEMSRVGLEQCMDKMAASFKS